MPEPLIQLRKIHYRYPGAQEGVLRDLDFTLNAGDRIALSGPNGSGKSTMLKLLVGLIRPDSGQLLAFGRERVCEDDFFEVRARAGLLFQNPDDQLFCATVVEDIAFGPFNMGKDRHAVAHIVEATLAKVGLHGFESRVSSRLSGGERRLLSLACVLAMEPDILLLDEPSSGLDSRNSAKLLACLKSYGKTMLIASHDKDFLSELTNHSLCLANGRIENA